MTGNGVALDIADAALVLALGAGPIGCASPPMKVPVAGKRVQAIVEPDLATNRVLVIYQRSLTT